MTLAIYFAKRFLFHFVLVTCAITAIAVAVNLLDTFANLDNNSSRLFHALRTTSLNTPAFISLVMPMTTLLAGMSFALSLSRRSEFVITRAAGQSIMLSLAAPTVVAFIIGIFSIIFFDPLAGRFERLAVASDADISSSVQVRPTGYWVRQSNGDGHQIIKALNVEDKGERLSRVTVLDYNAEGQISRRLFSKTAFLRNEQLILTAGKEWIGLDAPIAAPQKAVEFNFRRLPTIVTPSQFLNGFARPEEHSPITIGRTISELETAGFSALPYRSHFTQQLAKPFLLVVMLFLGAAFVLQSARFQRLEIAVLSALILGFSLHFLQNFTKTLGSSGEIPLWVAAWCPILAAAGGIATFFLYYEEG